mgnify:FL=1
MLHTVYHNLVFCTIMLCSPWEDVQTLTIGGVKQRCSPSDLEIYEQLGKGAYGVVHKMIHKSTQQIMAVKVYYAVQWLFDRQLQCGLSFHSLLVSYSVLAQY